MIEFLAAGFKKALDDKFEVQNTLFEAYMSNLLEQINQLKAGQELNAQKIQQLTEASTQEREQVGQLVSLSASQQTTISELSAKVNELLAQLETGNADTTAAISAVTQLLATSAAESSQIDQAIAGIQNIYNPS